jgi:hypothetical protein
MGLRADVAGETYYAGKPALFEELGFVLGRWIHAADGATVTRATSAGDRCERLATLERDGKTVVLVGTDSELLGVVAVADEVRPAEGSRSRSSAYLAVVGTGHARGIPTISLLFRHSVPPDGVFWSRGSAGPE